MEMTLAGANKGCMGAVVKIVFHTVLKSLLVINTLRVCRCV